MEEVTHDDKIKWMSGKAMGLALAQLKCMKHAGDEQRKRDIHNKAKMYFKLSERLRKEVKNKNSNN